MPRSESHTTDARTQIEPDLPGFLRLSGDTTPHEGTTKLYPDAYSIGSLRRKLEVVILHRPAPKHNARFVFEISGTPKDGEIQQPTEYRQGLWLSAAEVITIREARELGKWLIAKADEYERPKRRRSWQLWRAP